MAYGVGDDLNWAGKRFTWDRTDKKLEGEPALDKQVGGNHYKNMAIQPSEYNQKNKLGWLESSVVKYVSRHGNKNGVEDINKAIHCLELLKQIEYSDTGEV